MENPRPEKVAVVQEVRGRLASANASVVTEYRGLTVAQLAELRKNLAAVGDFKIYKNTLVRLAIAGSQYEELTELLSGPTAIAFVNGEISAAASAGTGAPPRSSMSAERPYAKFRGRAWSSPASCCNGAASAPANLASSTSRDGRSASRVKS
jgi:large subunit ribosomal protein L10